MRRFHVVDAGSNRVVQRVFQLNYTAWPDQGIPDSASPLLRVSHKRRRGKRGQESEGRMKKDAPENGLIGEEEEEEED